jgi:hypothetical protein
MKRPHRSAAARAMAGQSMTEYLVASIVLLMLIAVPVEGKESVVVMFLEAVRTAFARLSAFVSLPL